MIGDCEHQWAQYRILLDAHGEPGGIVASRIAEDQFEPRVAEQGLELLTPPLPSQSMTYGARY